MLDNLIDLIKQHAGNAITNNPAIPEQHNEAAVQEAGNSIVSTLQNALSGGHLNDVLNMFSHGQASADHPVVQQATKNFTESLQNKVGLNSDQAADVAQQVIPNAMNQLAQKTANSGDSSFNVQQIFDHLSGGKTAGMDLQGMMSKLKGGLDTNGDGNLDLQDLKSVFSGGGGDLLGKLKGMLG
jgi:hypothetical protein